MTKPDKPAESVTLPENWEEVVVRMRFNRSVLVPGGECRDEPENAEDLVEEIDRSANAAWLGGGLELALMTDLGKGGDRISVRRSDVTALADALLAAEGFLAARDEMNAALNQEGIGVVLPGLPGAEVRWSPLTVKVREAEERARELAGLSAPVVGPSGRLETVGSLHKALSGIRKDLPLRVRVGNEDLRIKEDLWDDPPRIVLLLESPEGT